MKDHSSARLGSARLSCILLLALCASAQANDTDGAYRTGQPEVLRGAAEREREAAQAEAQLQAQFKAAYAQAKRPSLLMLWHRELSDNLDSGRQATASVSSRGELARDNYDRTVTVQWKNGAERPVSLLPPARAAEFAAGFHQTLRSAGVVLVDRNTAMRMTALKQVKGGGKESELNAQTVEASALANYAKYFIEIRFVADAQSQGGAEPRVTVIESQSGEIVADVVPSHLYKPGSGQWVATNRGFVKSTAQAGDGQWTASDKGFEKRAAPPDGQAEGRRVAMALMQSLTEAWGAR